MPAKRMSMQITSGNYLSHNVPSSKPAPTASPPPSSSFHSMIQRIHNVRPGCGSCGK